MSWIRFSAAFASANDVSRETIRWRVQGPGVREKQNKSHQLKIKTRQKDFFFNLEPYALYLEPYTLNIVKDIHIGVMNGF